MDIKQAIQKTLQHEGGYVNNSHDKGGPTKFGITQLDLPTQNIQDLTVEQAIDYYQEHYVKPLYAQINNQLLGEKIFDMGVLFGVKTAVRLLQITMQNEINIVSDGNFGPETLSDVNQESEDLLLRYRTAFIQHVVNIVNHNPGDGVFVNGWVSRINS